MDVDDLRGWIRAEPFQPFRIHLADGRQFHGVHPEFVALAGRRRAFIGSPEGPYAILDLNLVTSIEVWEQEGAEQ